MTTKKTIMKKTTANSRLKRLRKEILSMKQAEFGSQINLTGSTISKMEAGEIALTDRNIRTICDTFHISESWLLTGEGGVFVPQNTDQQLAAGIAKLLDGGERFQKSMIAMLLQMDDSEWACMRKLVTKMAVLADVPPEKE